MKKFFIIKGFLFLLIISNLHAQDIPVSGTGNAGLKAIEDKMLEFMKKWNVPGGQLAFSKGGEIVYSKGLGYGDKENKVPATPNNIFRIASSSKPFTAMAILKLVQDGKLKLDDKAFKILEDLVLSTPIKVADPRIWDITVANLLEHSAGYTWEHGDPQSKYARIAPDALGKPRPAVPEDIVRYMLGQPLDFPPGEKKVYSNFGYNVLARIIEKVSGLTYEQYVQQNVLAPAGINDMVLAKTRFVERQPNEVVYYADDRYNGVWSVLDAEELPINMPYGGDFQLELTDGHGGWVSSAEDMVKFVNYIDPTTPGQHLLNADMLKVMQTQSTFPVAPDAKQIQGKGWNISLDGLNWQHSGAFFGTSSFVMRDGTNGVNWAVVFNYLPMEQLNDFFAELYGIYIDNIKDVKW
ncbi:MAG TPA: serine hydrolase domain-containing protein [Ignavibacteria bacterium]|nr:serine hydrolase domain-containing protein [Ignavibacteria bacterium]